MNDKLKKEVKEFLVSKFGDVDEDILLEELRYNSDEVYTKTVGSHRWFDDQLTVVKIDDTFIGFLDYYMTGDACASDMGLEFQWDAVDFYEPYEVTTTRYKLKGK